MLISQRIWEVHGAVNVDKMELENSQKKVFDFDSNEDKSLVLVVEDSIETGNAISQNLKCFGFETKLVTSVKAAIEFLTKHAPDIILSDYNLPFKSGLDLFKETRKHSSWSEIPFLFISGDIDNESRDNSLKLGADDFLNKPIVPAELLASIEGKLLKAKLRQQQEMSRFERFRKRVIHTLSHEFRTPLVSITTGTELLLDEYDILKDEQVKTLLHSILKGGQRLERLVDDFMVMQQIDIGYAEKSYRQFKGVVTINEIVETLKDKFKNELIPQYPNAVISYHFTDSVSHLSLDVFKDQFADAILRFVDNGLKFSLDSDRIDIAIELTENTCKFSIRDWGSGYNGNCCSENIKATAFEQFNRETYEQQGCGLGLSIASYFILLNQASYSIKKPEGEKGTLVEISVPIFKAS